MKEHVTNSLGHLSKLRQVIHFMASSRLGGFFLFSSVTFSQNLAWFSNGNVAMRNPYQQQSPCVIWEAKRGFSLLGRVCDLLLSCSG